jgi:DNA mismatch endonuclease (patch repair protein)
MADVFPPEKRSDIMRQVKSKRNKSTEMRLMAFFKTNGIKRLEAKLPYCRKTGLRFYKTKNCRFCRRVFLAWSRLSQYPPRTKQRVLDKKERAKY